MSLFGEVISASVAATVATRIPAAASEKHTKQRQDLKLSSSILSVFFHPTVE